MKDIKVGDYIRTYDGIIGKVFEDEDILTDGIYIDITFLNEWTDETNLVYFKDIVKHSKLISEVVEVGDYVNGKLIYKIDKGNNYCYLYYDDNKTFVSYQIKSIVTHEQFKNISYGV